VSDEEVPRVRVARRGELDRVIEVFALGFADDPVWGHWTLPETSERVEPLRDFWAPFVHGSAKYDGVVVLDDLSAVALWVPPGVPELDEAAEEEAAAATRRVCGERAALIDAGWELFAQTRPSPPHWYLSLLATDPAARGRGRGMALVTQVLERVDADGLPAYLESTNPGNVARYQRAGFDLIGYFDLPEGPRVDRMWRPARSAATLGADRSEP
jgi:GNAT superfamily N-acetyltransferase